MRGKTPRLGSPPEEAGEPGETCPLGAACLVLQDMLALKYGQLMDETDFMSKAKLRCDPATRGSPARLAEALNSEPALKLRDGSNERLLQLQLRASTVESFGELRSFVRRWPGTACALTAVAPSPAGRQPQLVAAFREAYSDDGALVGRAKARSPGKADPLLIFGEGRFQSAVVLDPVIVHVLKYESEPNRMLELQVPEVSAEYDRAREGCSAEAALAARACAALADLAPAPGSDPRLEKGATGGCALAAELMARHPGQADVQAAACHLFGNLVPSCTRTMPVADARTATELVIAAMRKHSDSPSVQEAACCALAGAAANRPELQSVAATNGGIEQVLDVMRSHPSNSDLQYWACGALASLAANHYMNQSAITANRGIEAVLAAMEGHPDDAAMQTMACGALGNLAANHGSNQTAISAVGGVETILGAMRQHADSTALQQAAVGALWCLITKCAENLAAVTRAGGAELIVAAVQLHPSDAALRALASGALQVLVPGLGGAMAPGSGPPGAGDGVCGAPRPLEARS